MSIRMILIIGVVVVVLIFVLMAVMILLGSRKEPRDLAIEKTGVPATARIVEIIDTGNRYNHNPEVRLKLEVQPEHGASFPAEVRTVISVVDLPAFQPGAIVKVKYEPDNPSVVVLSGR